MKDDKFWTEGPKDYSALFIEHCSTSVFKTPENLKLAHPFFYIEIALEHFHTKQVFKVGGIFGFQKDFDLINQIKIKEVEALKWFSLEYSALHIRKRNRYLNLVTTKLRQLHENLRKKEKEEIEQNVEEKNRPFPNYHNPILSSLEQSIRSNLLVIFSLHHKDLNQVNWNYLSKLFLPNAPILSFKRAHSISDEDFKHHFKTGLIDTDILDPLTDFRVFKNFFTAKPLRKKLEWRESLQGLSYLITELIDKGIIENPRNKHWKITYQFFTHNGNEIENLKSLGKPRKDLKAKIDIFIENFRSNSQK